MPIEQHFRWLINLFSGSADSDNDPQDTDRKENSYIDAQNMRNTSLDGHAGSISKIHGEVIKFPNIDNRCIGGTGLPMTASYKCIGSTQCLNHIVEFWADEAAIGIGYVRVDGWIVLMPTLSSSFPISTVFQPQLDRNDSCVGGEVFYTDNNIPPFILNVSDLLQNAGVNPANNLRDGRYTCTNKYLSGFLITQYQVQPPAQQDHPQFIEIVPTGSTPNVVGAAVQKGTGGIQVGMYQYAIQYVDASGNVTNWSEFTPQIPVPAQMQYNNPVFPSTKVYGGNPGTISLFGIHIRFRVTNLNNYASINIRRLSWGAGAALSSLPDDDSVIYTVNIVVNQIGIIDFYDDDNSTISPVTQGASTQNNLTAVQAAKGIRYYQSKLTLWNITYASRNLATSTIAFNTNNNTMYPFVRPLGVQGYKDIWNDVYRKSYFRGERYGFALVGFDSEGNPSFALPIPGSNSNFPTPNTFNNFQMPNRRDALSGASLLASTEVYNTSTFAAVPRTQCLNSAGVPSPTYEVFDQYDMVQRDPTSASVICGDGGLKSIYAGKGNVPGGTPDKIQGFAGNQWLPFEPYNDNDSINNFSYLPTIAVNDLPTGDFNIGSGWGQTGYTYQGHTNPIFPNFLPYNPKGFLPNLYALGMIIDGIGGLPNWCSAFAIVRTGPAGRVLAQGQSFYSFNPSQSSTPEWTTTNHGKDPNGVVWDSPDLLTGIANPAIVGNNPGNRYSMQFVAPIGFFSEVFSGWADVSQVISGVPGLPVGVVIPQYDREIDMISYCRIQGDVHVQGSALFNPVNATAYTMAGTVVNNFSYTAFNSWLNISGATPITANQEIVITSLNNVWTGGGPITAGSTPRRSCYYISAGTTPVYNVRYNAPGYDYGSSNWNEPTFTINIVDDTQNVTSALVQDYFQTGTFIKVSSIIGQIPTSSGVPQFYLVDERWQDCMPAICPTSQSPLDPLANQDRYVWIQDTNNNQFAWLNVTYKTSVQIAVIQAAIASAGYYVSTRCNGSTVQIYGMFTQRVIPYVNGNLTSWANNLYSIVFDQKTSTGGAMIPDAGDYVLVKYDSCAPIEIFGGDAFIGEYNYPLADCTNDAAGNVTGRDQFVVDWPSPYRAYQLNENTLIIHSLDPFLEYVPTIQGYNLIRHEYTYSIGLQNFSYVRQYLVNGIVESRTNTALVFNYPSDSNSYTDSFYPNINYVMRPLQWTVPVGSSNSDMLKLIQSQYFSIYGNENQVWNYGGFREIPLYNIDYSQTPTQDKSYSMPSSGFTEKVNYCSRVIWTPTRSTNEQNDPNLRNFPSNNIFDFDDATGEIKYAWDSSVSGQQGNLYAFTETGIVMALTNKSILTSISGGQLTDIGNSEDTFIESEVWLSRKIGMPDQMWRSAGEYSNKIYWADKMTAYKLQDNQITDIGATGLKYSASIKPLLASIAPGYGSDVTAVWNQKYEEYWLCLNAKRTIVGLGSPEFVNLYSKSSGGNPSPPTSYMVFQDCLIDIQGTSTLGIILTTIDTTIVTEIYVVNNQTGPVSLFFKPTNHYEQINIQPGQTLRAFWNAAANEWQFDTNMINLCSDIVWAEESGGWGGQYKFKFDKYVIDNQANLYAQRQGATWLLDSGYIQNGNNLGAWVLQTVNPKEAFQMSKEFIRIRINSNYMPDTVLFFQTIEAYMAGNQHSTLNGSNPLIFKNYGGNTAPAWVAYIGRGDNSPYYRNQGNYTLYQVLYSEPTEWWISSIAVKWKPLK